MVLRKLTTHLAVLGTLLAGTMGCVSTSSIEIGYEGFNDRLRPDRQPLDQQQTALEGRTDTLRFGPYRILANELTTPLRPGGGLSEHLPQSDCWWMGQSAVGGGDSMRANWEGIVNIVGDQRLLDDFHDPDDNLLDIGLCRLNDPQSRVPLRSKSDDSATFSDFDCSQVGNGTAFTVSGSRHLFRCTTDAVWLDARLHAYKTSSTDGLLRCENLRNGFTDVDRRIRRSVDFYDGVSAGPNADPVVEACASDRLLIPPSPTRYRVEQTPDRFAWLDPAVIPVQSASLGRVTRAQAGNVWVWSTPRSTHPTGGVGARWEENFSPSIAVSKVRFFELDGTGNRAYLNLTSLPLLCIEDPQGQSGCRWQCSAQIASDGRTEYNLFSPGDCKLSTGIGEIPRVTPTYALTTASVLVLNEPLRWSAQFTNPRAPFIELQLTTIFEPAALRAEPALTDLGGARTGQYARANFTVENVGGHPMRITAVAMDAAHGGNAPADFTLQLPTLPVPAPLPVEVTNRGTKETTLQLGRNAESQTLLTMFTDFAHLRATRRGGGFSARVGNHTVRDDHGLLLRDLPNPLMPYDPSIAPASRTSYALRTLPFTIQPGERFEVSVRGRPGATGDRTAFARISAESALDPTQRATIWGALKITGMQGPLILAAPGQLVISVEGSGVARDRAVLIQNAGDTTGTIGAPTLTAIGGGPIAAGTQLRVDDPYGGGGPLNSGASRVIHIDYLSDCSRNVVSGYRDEDAELRWTTPDGPVAVRIDTAVDCVP